MMSKPNHIFVTDGELFRRCVHWRDMMDQDCHRDHLRCGYWIGKDTKTATWLALRGCRFETGNFTTIFG